MHEFYLVEVLNVLIQVSIHKKEEYKDEKEGKNTNVQRRGNKTNKRTEESHDKPGDLLDANALCKPMMIENDAYLEDVSSGTVTVVSERFDSGTTITMVSVSKSASAVSA